MPDKSPDIPALVGSRICHDLISPLGAIGNGVELLTMSGTADGPEIALISESVANANARIRFFRIAFGLAQPGQTLAQTEIRSILADITKGGRLSIIWSPEGGQARGEVKLAFLLIQCLESALPYGGDIRVEHINGRWILHGKAEKMKIAPLLWETLVTPDQRRDITPAQVQFVLVPHTARRIGRTVQADLQDGEITLVF